MITIECIDNNGFEDQLTDCMEYKVKEVGSNGYLIENDNEENRWYGAMKFKYVRNDV